ncbi:MAG: hypothetical protein IPH44_19265 [Myxococcales bacterium]|nr:hypothetical protein [Myxococcales bacterium]
MTAASEVDNNESPFEGGCDVEIGRGFDVEAIKAAITVHDILGLAPSIKSLECPLHHGSRKSFSIFDGGRAWTCHADCGETGDVVTLWQRMHGVNAWEAIEALAALADVERGPTTPKPRRARSPRPGVAKGDARIARADALWYARWLAPRRDPGIDARGQRYLASRGLAGLCEALGTWRYYHLTFKGDGSPSTPIYTLERVSSYDSSAMINVAERLVAPSPTGPKVLVMKDHPTKFSFGRPDLLLAHSNLKRIVLVEGVIDYLTALLLWPPGGSTLVLGAHAVGQVVPIVAGLLDDEEIAPRLRRLPLTLIPHADPAGVKAHTAVLALCGVHAVNATTFDLAGCGDLNEWIRR